MNTLLAVALALPLLGAAVVAATGVRGRSVAVAASLAASAAWAGVAAADGAPALGRIVATPLVAAAAGGAALLVAVALPRATFAASAMLCGVTLFAVAAGSGDGDVPDRPLAVGTLLLVGAVSLRIRADGAPLRTALVVLVAGVALAAGWSVADLDVGAAVAVLGAGVVLVVSTTRPTASVLAPVVVLVVARMVPAAGPVAGGGVHPPAVAAAAVAAVAVALTLRRWRSVPARPDPVADPVPGRPGASPATVGWAPAPGVLVVLAGVVLLSQDLVGLRAAGLLLATGGVIAAAAATPLALVAAVPGVVAAVEAFGRADEPEHALAGAAVAALLVLAATGVSTGSDRAPAVASRTFGPADWPVALAVCFAVVPLWGWTGASLDAYSDSLATGAAAGLVAVGALVTVSSVFSGSPVFSGRRRVGSTAPDAEPAPTGSGRAVGRLRRRPAVANHGSTHTEEAGPLEGHEARPEVGVEGASARRVDEGRIQEGRLDEGRLEEGRVEEAGHRPEVGTEAGNRVPPKRLVAVAARAVPGRAAGDGERRGRRLRARAGRPPG